MKKLMITLSLLMLTAQPQQTCAMDQWTVVALAGSALVISAVINYHQAQRITTLETKLTKKKAFITTLTQERDGLKKQLEQPVTLWSIVVKRFRDFIPFMCVKESVAPVEELALIGTLGFERSQKKHKMPGLVTFISTNPQFTKEEKNLVSDEEDELDERDRLLEDIGSDLEELDLKITRIRNGETDELE